MDIKFLTDPVGTAWLVVGVIASLVTMSGYVWALLRPKSSLAKIVGRIGYSVTAISVLGAFFYLAYHVYHRDYLFEYVVDHTGNELTGWYRFAATWSGQEGSFGLWAAWTAIIGFLVMARAGRYEARIMPFFVSILTFLCLILLKQTPFHLFPKPTPDMYAANPGLIFPFVNGRGLNPSLQNYWMTIHPPTIFFGFASLAVPFVYSIAAILWRDYENWTHRVMPYALLSCATLGGGLFMGGYWAYETQGWHGFWAWDPVENASFFPWLAITALMHGLVVQKHRGGMARTNTFLGILGFTLFLVGTFLTRSGALAEKDAGGQLLSVHAFDNISKDGKFFMVAMLAIYGGGGLLLWLARVFGMPKRPSTGETLVSRDFAMFMSVLLLMVACVIVTLGTTQPLIRSWMHQSPWQPKASFYNMALLPLSLATALFMGFAPWVAWRKTNGETFLKKLLVPWFAMLTFGFFMVFWAISAERALTASLDPNDVASVETMMAWHSTTVQRLSVVALASLGFFAALSNAMLAYRVFRAKPLSAGGWIAHVGIGVMIIGVIVSNTYERTMRVDVVQGQAAKDIFGYKFEFEKMTGKPMAGRPINPEYDYSNAVQLRVTPPNDEGNGADDGTKTFLIAPRWFVHNKDRAEEDAFERMRWPSIVKYAGHDLYVGLANDPGYAWPTENGKEPGYTFQLKEKKRVGPYTIGYYDNFGEPGRLQGVRFLIVPPPGMIPDDKPQVVQAIPALRFETGPDAKGEMTLHKIPVNVEVPELKDAAGNPGVIYVDRIDPATKAASVRISFPGAQGRWEVPLEVTYKPWVNLVWIGVVTAVAGVLLAMLRRMIEALKIGDLSESLEGRVPPLPLEAWETPEAEPVSEKVPAGASAIRAVPKARRVRPKPQA